MFDLSGKRALVTGSSQGIGLALAQGLAVAGARVILNGRDRAKLARAREGFADPERVEIRPFDVTDEAAVKLAIDAIEAESGPLDILVNNTGIQIRNPLERRRARYHRERRRRDGVRRGRLRGHATGEVRMRVPCRPMVDCRSAKRGGPKREARGIE